jgi:exosortase/archaeosortase family protein
MRRISQAQAFGARFLALLVGASIATWAVDLPNRLAAIQRMLAGSAAWIASFAGSANRVVADQIFVKGLTININYECTGAYVLLILVTFLVSYPARWRDRAIGIGVGIAALTALNILRIAVLVRVAEIRPDLFAYFHEYVWQGVFLVLVIVYAMAWVERVR